MVREAALIRAPHTSSDRSVTFLAQVMLLHEVFKDASKIRASDFL
jgi:hypothetical protein